MFCLMSYLTKVNYKLKILPCVKTKKEEKRKGSFY